eukprot:g5040.t1
MGQEQTKGYKERSDSLAQVGVGAEQLLRLLDGIKTIGNTSSLNEAVALITGETCALLACDRATVFIRLPTFTSLGKKLFIISKGVVELLKTDNMLRIETRADGGHFGMISILPEGPTQGKRVCSVRTMTYCDFRTISRRTFNRGVRRYPGVKEDVEHMVEKEFNKFTELCERTLNPLGGAGKAMEESMHSMLASGGLFGLSDNSGGESDTQPKVQKQIATTNESSSKRASHRKQNLVGTGEENTSDGDSDNENDDERNGSRSFNLIEAERLRKLMDRLERFLNKVDKEEQEDGDARHSMDLTEITDGGEGVTERKTEPEKGGVDE